MTTVNAPDCVVVDKNRLPQSLAELRTLMDNGVREFIVDFSAVRRLDSAALRAMEELARAAEEKKVTITVRGVTVEIYKVLKLARISEHFRFER